MVNNGLHTKGRIALLNAPYLLNEPFFQHMPTLSLLYLAAYVEKIGFEPKIFNLDVTAPHRGAYYFGFDLSRLWRGLTEFKPDLVGITCPYSARWPFANRLIRLVRSKLGRTPIVIGGIHPTAFPEYCLSESNADYVIIGEGEYTLGQLAESLARGEDEPSIDGVAYRNGHTVTVRPKQDFIHDLDGLPFPAYHLLNMERYRTVCRNDRMSKLKGINLSLLTSRSCPNQCTYCNMFLSHGKKWRSRSPENVLEEIELLINRYGIKQFSIVDDNFLLSRRRAIEILSRIIEKKLGIRFITPNGLSVKTLDDELVLLLKRAGALEISIAVESGSDFIRNQVYNKRISTDRIVAVVRSCKRHGLPVRAFFMIGAPGETDETVNESIRLMRALKIPAHINITTPYKGTVLYDHYLRNGIVKDEDVSKGTSLDIRLPIETAENYGEILRWRRKMQVANIVYSLGDIIKDSTFMRANTIHRFLKGIVFPQKIDEGFINDVLDRYLNMNRAT